MAGDPGAGSEREKIVIALGIAGGVEGNGAKGARLDDVRRGIVLEGLDIRPEFEAEMVINRKGAPVTMAEGLRVSEIPFLRENWLRRRTTSVTMQVMISLGRCF